MACRLMETEVTRQMAEKKTNKTILDVTESTETAGQKQIRTRKSRAISTVAKILCLIAAFSIWLYAKQAYIETSGGSDRYDVTVVTVPVKLLGTSELESGRGLYISSGYSNTVDISLKGEKQALLYITTDDITATADVSRITETGSYNIGVDVSISDTLGVKMVNESALTIPVEADVKGSVTLNLSVDPIYTKPTSYEIDFIPDKTTVAVTGPRATLSQIALATVRLNIGTVTTSLVATGEVKLYDASGNEIINPYLDLEYNTVQVNIPVFIVKEITLAASYKYGYYNKDNVSITIKPPTAMIKGDPKILENIDTLSAVVIDEKTIMSNTTKKETIMLPDGLAVVGETQTVTVGITHIGTITRQFKVTGITTSGGNSLYNYEILTSQLTVTLRGTPAQLEAITDDSIIAKADLSALTQGTEGLSEVPVKISITSDDSGSVYEVGQYFVQCNITPKQ